MNKHFPYLFFSLFFSFVFVGDFFVLIFRTNEIIRLSKPDYDLPRMIELLYLVCVQKVIQFAICFLLRNLISDIFLHFVCYLHFCLMFISFRVLKKKTNKILLFYSHISTHDLLKLLFGYFCVLALFRHA